VSACAVGEKIQLLFLDAVFHIPTATVKVLVQSSRNKPIGWRLVLKPFGGRLVTVKRGLSPLGKISTLPITRRGRLQLSGVAYSNSTKLRQGRQ